MKTRFLARKNRFPFLRPVHWRRKLLVRMDTTNHCNLRCSMCPMRLSKGDEKRQWFHMPMELFSRIEEDVFPYARTVGISCGAEPLTNPSFPEHLRRLLKSGVPYREMVTNGTLLNSHAIDAILSFPPTTMFVSIDGADPRTHGAIRDGADLSKITGNLRGLIRARGKRAFPMVGFSVTLQRDNYRQLEDIVRLAERVGAISVGAVPLVPYAGLDTLNRVVDMQSSEVRAALGRAEETASSLGIRLSISGNGPVRTTSHPCPYLGSTVYIDPSGSIFPCPYWNTGRPLGNVVDGFERVWLGDEYIRLRAGAFEKADNCRHCPEVSGEKQEVLKEKQ